MVVQQKNITWLSQHRRSHSRRNTFWNFVKRGLASLTTCALFHPMMITMETWLTKQIPMWRMETASSAVTCRSRRERLELQRILCPRIFARNLLLVSDCRLDLTDRARENNREKCKKWKIASEKFCFGAKHEKIYRKLVKEILEKTFLKVGGWWKRVKGVEIMVWSQTSFWLILSLTFLQGDIHNISNNA